MGVMSLLVTCSSDDSPVELFTAGVDVVICRAPHSPHEHRPVGCPAPYGSPTCRVPGTLQQQPGTLQVRASVGRYANFIGTDGSLWCWGVPAGQ